MTRPLLIAFEIWIGGAPVFEKIGFSELAVILVVALLIFGPSKLPSLGKSVGEGIREFKKSMKEISTEVTGDDKQA